MLGPGGLRGGEGGVSGGTDGPNHPPGTARAPIRVMDALPGRGRGVSLEQKGNSTQRKRSGASVFFWVAEIRVTEDSKHRQITIAYFAREEDAARAY